MNPGYLFLLMTLFFGTSKGFCGKKISGAVHGVRPALAFNALRMAFCVLIGLVILLITGETLAASGRMLGIAALNGVSTAVSVVSWVLAVQYSAYTMLDVFLMLGTMVPAAGGALFLGEVIAPRQLIGLAVLIGAVGLMCGYSSRAKRKLTLRDLPLLLLAGLAGGLCAFTQKLFRYYCAGEPVLTFNFYTYAAGAYLRCRQARLASPDGRRNALPSHACLPCRHGAVPVSFFLRADGGRRLSARHCALPHAAGARADRRQRNGGAALR